ncbi:hypothetical protein BZG36_00607 [Bifiguratus adelaidae]|uniref:EamA domain-containing protein n=1 Tax=Bifiguratus adelaidae TaxID=1938954 RepID=A0A261Y7G1_9FUNG|nr:hypothetical protein BZG36_00607 [Bifiguratus adelaidae]
MSSAFFATCWGFTNPFIRRGSQDIEAISNQYPQGGPVRWLAETRWLLTRWQYVLPLALNLSGSVVYYYAIDLSQAVPITNSLTLIFTVLAGALLGEEQVGWETFIGGLLIVAGIGLCAA